MHGRAWKQQRKEVVIRVAAACAVCLLLSISARAEVNNASRQTGVTVEADPAEAMLETGFRQLYELNFQGAREQFLYYQKARPADPLGKAAEAASYLYEELNAKGVFTSEFFLNDSKLLSGVDGKPSANKNEPFMRANNEAREMAKRWLKEKPNDPHGLLVLTLADGMESDYDALIEKKQLASLSLMRQAEREANALLAIDPNAQDAYVALGASNYIIGCMPGFKRAFLWFGGVHGDRVKGMQEMQMAADHGHYLRPFAKILLALACEREHQMDRARKLLTELAAEFPANPLYAHEITLLNRRVAAR
ncbi:MAG TPA: hypothetical protein VHX36_10605 [Candidatus Acidoferrales bacterium]|jgi:hypothetical protein|nr:hypothetical protein [Candidatus Acidoferrales bacterium]